MTVEHQPLMATRRPPGAIRFVTVAEAATAMRVSKMTIYRLVHNEELVSVRVGRSIRITYDSFVRYMAKGSGPAYQPQD